MSPLIGFIRVPYRDSLGDYFVHVESIVYFEDNAIITNADRHATILSAGQIEQAIAEAQHDLMRYRQSMIESM